jgi:hypothetical protein
MALKKLSGEGMSVMRHTCLTVFCMVAGIPTIASAVAPEAMSPVTLKVPDGPTSPQGLGEAFSPDTATGLGSYRIPIELPPGFVKPDLALAYSIGWGRGDAGLGFKIPHFNIYRSTSKGMPSYRDSDLFAVDGPGINDELVFVSSRPASGALLFRLKNETAYALFELKQARGRSILRTEPPLILATARTDDNRA